MPDFYTTDPDPVTGLRTHEEIAANYRMQSVLSEHYKKLLGEVYHELCVDRK